MRVRLLLAAGVLSFVPAFVRAQDVPATVPPQESPAPVAAHRGGSFEFSLGGGLSLIDKAFNDSLATNTARIVNQVHGTTMRGGQLRVTYNLSSHLGIGAGAGMTNGNGALLLDPFGALTYTFGLNRGFSPFIEIGGGLTRISAYTGRLLGERAKTSSVRPFGGLGFRAMLSNALALRVEWRMSSDKFGGYGKSALNGAGFVGLSLFVGGRSPRDADADGDGVTDRNDACADTPVGATVDSQGCALDSDRDGVYDGLDLCADTPAGATVDAQGCALDGDRDGVYDGLDRCPDTPAGAPVDANGCPVASDADGDGVIDANDRCANTPAGVAVDANGCPRDTDNDGVADVQDRCPNTAVEARPVNPAGHAQAGCPADSDADGVLDYLDRCANTAPNTQVDASGCPVQRDTDNDGVIDTNDRCANTPPNTRVDAGGCPLPEPVAVVPAPAAGAAPVIRSITFIAGSSVLRPWFTAQLYAIAVSLRAVPDARWEIAGYTDNREASGLSLSRRRAERVRRDLVARGVPSTSLTTVGYGAQNPVASNATPAGRVQNRRVEIKRIQ